MTPGCQPEPATRALEMSVGMQKETDGNCSETYGRHQEGQSHIQTQVQAVLRLVRMRVRWRQALSEVVNTVLDNHSDLV